MAVGLRFLKIEHQALGNSPDELRKLVEQLLNMGWGKSKANIPNLDHEGTSIDYELDLTGSSCDNDDAVAELLQLKDSVTVTLGETRPMGWTSRVTLKRYLEEQQA